MPFHLRDKVHWCISDGRVVFLDIQADRYFCLPAAANDAFLRLAAGQSQARDCAPLQMLVSRGILVEDGMPAAIKRAPLVEAAERDVADNACRSSVLYFVQEFVSELVAARMLRTRTFAEIIATIERKGRSARHHPPHDLEKVLQAIAGAAIDVSFLTRMHDRCLVRALAVHSMCTRRGIRPKLVFGVIAHPFAAHCWVQVRNAVLVGGVEEVRLYTPILAIE